MIRTSNLISAVVHRLVHSVHCHPCIEVQTADRAFAIWYGFTMYLLAATTLHCCWVRTQVRIVEMITLQSARRCCCCLREKLLAFFTWLPAALSLFFHVMLFVLFWGIDLLRKWARIDRFRTVYDVFLMLVIYHLLLKHEMTRSICDCTRSEDEICQWRNTHLQGIFHGSLWYTFNLSTYTHCR